MGRRTVGRGNERSEDGGELRRVAADLLLVIGGILLAFPLWSGLFTTVQQGRLEDAYGREAAGYRIAVRTAEDLRSKRELPPERELRRLAKVFAARLEAGDPVGRLQIRGIGLDTVVQQGATGPASLDPDGDRALLRKGPVHYGNTPLPGAGEPFAVAGHRTTYGAPFSRLDELRPGDRMIVQTPYAALVYEVAKVTTVEPDDVGVLLDRGYGLVLTTCTPRYSASHRLIVWGTLESFKLLERLSSQG
jgi:sortase A